jgi:alpha-galactosidase
MKRPLVVGCLSALTLTLAAQLGIVPARAADNGLGAAPLMGWSSWSHFKKNIDETVIKAQADAMASQLKSFGYTYINLDSGWRDFTRWDEFGRETWDTAKFPSGVAALAAYIHGKGLKFGIYLHPGMDLGPNSPYELNTPILGTPYHARDITDATQYGNTGKSAYRIDFSKPGAREYVQGYADLVASWGVDYIKFDFVGPGGGTVAADSREDMQQWLTALTHTPAGSAPIWIELSNSLSFADVATWKTVANGWRINGDIESGTGGPLASWTNVNKRFTDAPKWAPFAGPGGWNDFDAVPIGDGSNDGLTATERQTTMTLWSIGCSPLLLGSNISNLDAADKVLITNAEAIAINQAGRVATPISQASSQQVWRVQNADGSFTVALFNLGSSSATVTAKWSDLGFSGAATVRDLWSHTELGSFVTSFAASVPSHGSRLLKVTSTPATQVATPTFTPPAGTYTSTQNVAIASATGSATIRYTIDGSTPTASNGTLYTAPIAITASTTVKAFASKAGLNDSPVATALYTINVATTVAFEAETTTYTASGATASVQVDAAASGGKWLQLAGNSTNDYLEMTSPQVAAGTYQIKLVWKANNNRGKLSFKIDGTQVGSTLDQYASGVSFVTTTIGTQTFSAPGTHKIRLTVTGKNSASSSYNLSADQIVLIKQ